MGIKVVILFLLSLCLTSMGRGDEVATGETDSREVIAHSYTLTDSHSRISSFASILGGSASSNINVPGSYKHKMIYKYLLQMHGNTSGDLDPMARKACKHSRPICDMRLLRHLILLEKIII